MERLAALAAKEAAKEAARLAAEKAKQEELSAKQAKACSVGEAVSNLLAFPQAMKEHLLLYTFET